MDIKGFGHMFWSNNQTSAIPEWSEQQCGTFDLETYSYSYPVSTTARFCGTNMWLLSKFGVYKMGYKFILRVEMLHRIIYLNFTYF